MTTQSEAPKKDDKKDETSSSSLFDISKQIENATKDGKDFLQTILRSVDDEENATDSSGAKEKDLTAPPSNETGLFDQMKDAVTVAWNSTTVGSEVGAIAPASTADRTAEKMGALGGTFMDLVTGRGNASTVEDLVEKARSLGEQGDLADKASLSGILSMIQSSVERLEEGMDTFLQGDSLPVIHPSNLFYYLEREDEVKNPSWRRRKHRFYPGVDVDKVDELNAKLGLAKLSYTKTMEEIRNRLENEFNCEMMYCSMNSQPLKPSHFVAVKKDQSQWSSSLECLLVVRGTDDMNDVITDLIASSEDYRGGKAHSGMLESGRFLANKHKLLFQKLLELSGKRRIKLELIGHSLGAGAASIAAIELNDLSYIDVEVYGFGSPALLSKDLSETTKPFITTIVADNDVVPRLSAATLVNAILDVGQYDWLPNARRDISEALEQVQGFLPALISDESKSTIASTIEELLTKTVTIPPKTEKRMEQVLYPAGKCIHFYRDGFGISGSEVPCTFFSEIDLSRRLIDDHLYYSGYKLIFLEMMRQYHNDHYFQFDIDTADK